MNKIVTFISDTHTKHRKVSELIENSLQEHGVKHGSLLLCTGDCMSSGYYIDELIGEGGFIEWFASQPFDYKVFIPGNHDRFLESSGQEYSKNMFERYYDNGVRYLHNEGIKLEFDDNTYLTIWGSADQPIFFNWAFNHTPEELYMSYSQIPENLDILATHCPCYDILDKSHVSHRLNPTGENPLGSQELLDAISNLQTPPRYHCFGHIHGDGGKMITIGNTTYINASVCDEGYKPVNKIITLEIEAKQNEVEE